MRIALIVLGVLSLLCAIAGIVLPLLPTTPFLLLSAFLFARSSDRLHDWLLQHPYFGKSIRDWQESGAISRRNKVYAVGVIAATMAASVALSAPPPVLITQAAILTLVALFILTRPDGPS